MVTIAKISKSEIAPLVAISYQDDKDLVEKYFPVKQTESETVQETISMIDDASKMHKCKYFKIMYNKKPIGYFVIWEKFLYSFAINVNYRKKDILVAWWNEMKKVTGNFFESMLYDVNTRAISFLEKCGMVVSKRDKNLVMLIHI